MKNPLRLIDRRSLFIILGAAVLITLISVIIIIITTTARNRRALISLEEAALREQRVLSRSLGVGIEDFYRDMRNPDHGPVYPSRSRQSHWSREDVQFYWIDPADAGLETLSSDNDADILRSLNGAVAPQSGAPQ